MTEAPQRVLAVWLESVEPGTAAGHHLAGTMLRLRSTQSSYDVKVAASTVRSARRRLPTACWKALCETRRRTVVVARWHFLLLPLQLIWKALGIPTVLLVQGTIHDAYAAHPRLKRVPMFRLMWTASLKLGDAHMCPHDEIANWVHEELPAISAVVIPNGPPISESPKPGVREALGLPRDYVFYGGALASWQGVETMIAATEQPEWPNMPLVIVGDGERAPVVQAAVSERIIWLGRQTPETVAGLLTTAMCALSVKNLDEVTRRGVSPFKLLEAGKYSVPVVASSVPGQSEYVNEAEAGVLVPPSDPEAVARAVKLLSVDEELRRRLGRNAFLGARGRDWAASASLLERSIQAVSTWPRGHRGS